MATARDLYREYFAARLWDRVPGIYRELDAEVGDVHRAIMRAFGSQFAVARRSQDRLWDDMYVELADDWAIPYIAELVATRLVSALNPRARRADVAKTIYYRRRKGTLPVLEQLIRDIADWEGKVVEEFRRLGRMRHGLDGPALTGRITRTPEGGLANLRSVRGALLAGGPFDELSYTPEMRPPRGHRGLRGIQTLGFHLYRLESVAVPDATPFRVKDLPGTRDFYTFDPSGRDVPLFSGRLSARSWAGWVSAGECDLPRAIDCRLANEELFEIGDPAIAEMLATPLVASLAARQAAANDLRNLVGQRFAGRAALLRLFAGLPESATLMSAGVPESLLAKALDPASGSVAADPLMVVHDSAGVPVPRDAKRAADLSSWPTPAVPGVDLLIDPALGRFLYDTPAGSFRKLRVDYRFGWGIPVGAGAIDRRVGSVPATVHWQQGSSAPGLPVNGVVEIDDSSSFDNPPGQPALTDLVIRAAEGARPFVPLAADWQLDASSSNRTLEIDGLWIGGRAGGQLRLDGDYARVVLRYCTLDPGGLDAAGAVIPPCGLVVAGTIDELVVDRCILPGIVLTGAIAGIDRIVITDSIVDAQQAGSGGIVVPQAHVTMMRCTMIAPAITVQCLHIEWLDATDSLIAGQADVTNLQAGCFRFSARGPGSRVPHPYRSVTLDDGSTLFAARRFGDPHYASLSARAPDAVRTGSEEQCEMGVYCGARRPIRFDGLRAKVEEYMPFGRLPAFIEEN